MENELQISRIPETVNGIQVNFCENPQCPNFGVPASNEKQPGGPGASERGLDLYIVQGGVRSDSSPRIECRNCKEKPPLKSNKGIYDETTRMLKYLEESFLTCPNPECANHSI